jgi:transcriptional regulator with XRE-family HTH domain
MTLIATLLKTWRTERGFSLSGLALKAGIGKATLSRWEAGQKLPRIAELESVIDALGVSSAQRHEALVSLEVPRALHRLRETNQDVPLRGDLLRAMRMRRRRTQTEVAAQIGVSQATLAKWEATEDWPSVERLHALCYALEAHEDEVVALTRMRPASQPEQVTEITWDTYWTQIFSMVFSAEVPLLGDLVFHSAESELWRAIEAVPIAETLLAMLYAYHARWLSEFGRDQEAIATAQRALRRVGAHPPLQDDWLNAVVTLARELAQRRSYSEAIRLLRTYLPQAKTPKYRAWLAADLARYQSEVGDADSAIRLSLQAARIARQEAPVEEFWFRRFDHAEILLKAGHPAEALRWLPLDQGEPPTRNLVAPLLVIARTLLALGNPGEAQSYIERAKQLIDRYDLAHHQQEVKVVIEQYERPRKNPSPTTL